MGSELKVEVSQQELAYRSKYYHDIRAIRQRELSCASCANVVSDESGRVFSHPILGVLQCRKCKDHFNDTPLNINDSVKSCSLCGIAHEFVYKCSRKNCPHQFCKACIKRNAPLSLDDARTERWKCFACNTKPLWKLRGVCAAIMSTIPKRTKTKKVSRNRSSDREDVKSVLKDISYVRRNLELDARKLNDRLRSICDTEPPYEPVQRQLYSVPSSQQIPPVTTSDDSDAKIMPLSKKKKLKKKSERQENLPESRMKRLASVQNGSRVENIVGPASSKDKKKASVRADSITSKVALVSNCEILSDSDSDVCTVSILSTIDEQKNNDENRNSKSQQKVLIDSSDEGSDDAQKGSNSRSRKSSAISAISSSRAKSAKTTRNNDELSKHSRVVGGNERKSVAGSKSRTSHEDAESTRERKTRINAREKSSDNRKDSHFSSRMDTMNQRTRDAKEDHESRESRKSQKNENIDGKTRKSYVDMKHRKAASDESSGKDFQKLKVIRNSYVSLRRLSEIEKDRTRSPTESPEVSEDIMSKDQTFALKNTVNNFFEGMRIATTKLLNDIEKAQTIYRMKDSMLTMDADRMVLEAKNIAGKLIQHVKTGENKMADRYDKWCKKTKVKNVLNNRRSNIENEKPPVTKTNPRKSRTNTAASENESSASTRIGSPTRSREATKNPQSSTTRNSEQSPAVSDCNSEDIFTDDEMRNSHKKSNPVSPSQRSRESSPNVKIAEEKSTEGKKTVCLDDINDRIDQIDDERMSSTETAVEDDNRNILENAGSKSPVVSDSGRKLSLDTSVIDNEDNKSENSDSLSLSFVVSDNENNVEISRAKSPVVRDSEKQLSLDTSIADHDEENEDLDPKSPTVMDNDNGKISNGTRSKSPAVVDDDDETMFDAKTSKSSTVVDRDKKKNCEATRSESAVVGDRRRRSSLAPIVDGDVEKKQNKSSSKSPSIVDSDNEDNDENPRSKTPVEEETGRHSSLDTLLDNDNEDGQEKSTCDLSLVLSDDDDDGADNLRSESPVVEKSQGIDDINENENEKSVSKSLVAEDCTTQSSLDTILNEDNERKGKKSDSTSSLDKNSTRGSLFSDDVENLLNKLDSTSSADNDSRPVSNSSEISDTEEARMKEALLASSNSDDSSGEASFPLQKSKTKEPEEALPTPPESDSNSKSMKKTRSRRRKFCIEDNRHVMADEKLKLSCEVRMERLGKRVLRRYGRALKKSRDSVESRMLKRLVKLDNLDKDKKVASNSTSENEDASVSSKDVKNKKKVQGTKEREETLMDHLERIANGANIELGNVSDGETSISGKDSKNKLENQTEDSLFDEANRMAKKRLLESSDSAEEEPAVIESEDDQKTKQKTEKVVKKTKVATSPEDEDKTDEKSDASRWRKNKLLTLRISDSDSQEDKEQFESRLEKLSEKKKNQGSQSDSEEEETPKKKRVRRRVLHSDSDVKLSDLSNNESSDDSIMKKNKKGSDGDSEKKKKEGKKKTRKRTRRGERRSSDSSDSMEEKRPKVRRKRIKTAGSDSDSENDLDDSQGTPGKSGRKNIRKVIRDKQVADDTKQAAKDEEERLKRIAERQKLYNEMYEVRLAGEQKVEKLVLDFDEETKEPLVSVDEALVKRLKPHQAQGIKFMWDACFESLERTKTTPGSGCILAHCMGLGKSFQVVSLSHTLLQHKETGIKTVMVVCPLSTVLNWVNEFKIWLEDLDDGDDIEVYELTKMKKHFERKYQLQRWQETGGVMIIGYEMFRNLSSPGGKKIRKNIQAAFLKCLVDPGPDLIVCDEGHLLKNEDTALSKAMRRVKTLRRIVLTGTPLQNNLIEYHCMVQFVKPKLLGTKKEFMNRFENPITNGQFDDSTEYDVKLMKKRAHVLHKMLEGSVQRLDYSVLTPFLPPKQEYVIFVKLTEIQIKMYEHYLEYYARRHRGVGSSLFADFQALQRIWTHPMVLQMNAEKVVLANEKKRLEATDTEGSLKDFIDDGSNSDSSSNSSDIRSINGTDDDSSKKPKRGTRANPVVDEPLPVIIDKSEETNDEIEWWTQFVREEDHGDMRISSKLLILFSILKESEHIGDKVLVFSQSLYSLSLIEKFLAMIDDETQDSNAPDTLGNHSGSWSLGLDYFRLDGQTSPDNRRRWCEIFNRPSNTRARLFLISTRAGGLGINLTAANRVIIFDASWNPSHDVQSIFRIYRFGQKKPCYVYRLLAAGTMEEKIYNRQVTKLSLSCRVVDEQQIERHYSNNALAELYKLEISDDETTLNLPKDRVLAEIFLKYKNCVRNYHEHDSLLENQAGEELDEEERHQAWLEYEEEKKGKRIMPQMPMNTYQNEILMQQMNMINFQQQHGLTNPAMMVDLENIQRLMVKDYPGVTEAQHKMMASRAVYEMYNYVERQALSNQNVLPMLNMGVSQLNYDNRIAQVAPTSSHPTPEMLRLYQQSLIQRQQHNGQPQMNYPMNPGIMGDTMGHSRNNPIGQMSQLPVQPSVSTVLDEDVVEIPSSPEKNSVPPAPAPGGSRKSQEE